MTTTKKSLNEKLFAIMEAINSIPKDGYNDFHKYAYATERAIKDAVRTQLLAQRVLFRYEIVEVTTTGELTVIKGHAVFSDVDSDAEISVPFAGQGADKGDKGIYKAITGAIKYALTSTFLIPTGDDAEADTSTDKRHTASPKQPMSVQDTAAMFNGAVIDNETGEVQNVRVCQKCGNEMHYKEGTAKSGKAWKGYFCASGERDHTEWVK